MFDPEDRTLKSQLRLQSSMFKHRTLNFEVGLRGFMFEVGTSLKSWWSGPRCLHRRAGTRLGWQLSQRRSREPATPATFSCRANAEGTESSTGKRSSIHPRGVENPVRNARALLLSSLSLLIPLSVTLSVVFSLSPCVFLSVGGVS